MRGDPALPPRVYAVCIYAGLRKSECRGLVASDVDFEHGTINVRRQRKKRGASTSSTKTRAGIRQVPIHANRDPLLSLLVERSAVDLAKRRADDDSAEQGPLVHVPPVEDCAEKLRDVDLPLAGCKREELYVDDDVRQHFTFHGSATRASRTGRSTRA